MKMINGEPGANWISVYIFYFMLIDFVIVLHIEANE